MHDHLVVLEEDQARGRCRVTRQARGRFTRNFVVQASAADWAIVLLAGLRRRLAAISAPSETAARSAAQAARLVFFQHDEVIVHCPEGMAGAVADAVGSAAAEAGQLVFGPTPVRFPVTTAVVASYADAK